MTKENGVKVLTDMVADFVAHIGKKITGRRSNKNWKSLVLRKAQHFQKYFMRQ